MRGAVVTGVDAASRVTFHPLVIRESDDDPEVFVVGRAETGEFVEVPEIGARALRLLGAGLSVEAVEDRLTRDGERPDVAGLLDDVADLGWIATLDGRALPDPVASVPTQARWLRPDRLRWVFSRPAAGCLAVLVVAATVTVVRRPDLLPGYRDFFWSGYAGVATLVNTLLFLTGALVHEVMHLAAARSLGLPARIGLGTRLSNLALQTDVSAAWAVPRRQRYRIYLAGMAWDAAAVSAALLVQAYAGPSATVGHLLAAYVLVSAAGVVVQTQIYMRTDLFFVVMDLLRCGDLFHDGLRQVRYLGTRAVCLVRRRPVPPDPARALPARERRAVRVYAPLVLIGSVTALGMFAVVGVPVLVETVARGVSEITALASGGSRLRAIDGGLLLLAECGLQGLFLFAFHRSHPTWFGWGSRRPRGRR
jgi:putative peptide zinc metalloprotease protein